MRTSGFLKFFRLLVLYAVIMLLTGCDTGPSKADIEANRQALAEKKAQEAAEREEKAREAAEAKRLAEEARLKRLQEEHKIAEEKRKAVVEEAKAKALALAKAKAEASAAAKAEAEKQRAEQRALVDQRRGDVLRTCDELAGLARALDTAATRSDQIATGNQDELKRKASAARNQVATYERKAQEARAQLANTPSLMGWRCPNLVCSGGNAQETVRRPADGKCGACGTTLVQSDPNASKRMKLESDVKRYETYVASYKQQADQAEAALAGTGQKESPAGKIAALSRRVEDLRAQATGAGLPAELESVERGLDGVKVALDAIKATLPAGLVRSAAAATGNAGAETPTGEAKKVYVMADGSKLEVISEMKAGDDIIVKTPTGMVNIKKGDIRETLK